MAVTSSYAIDNLKQPSLIYSYGEQSTYSTITALAHGGYAALAVDADGFDDLAIYNAKGDGTGSNFEVKFTNARLTALANGNVLMVGTVASGGLEYRIFDTTGKGVGFGSISRDTSADQVSTVGTPDGGFTAAYRTGSATTGIAVMHYNASGVMQTVHIQISTTDVWENPSIARLANGGYAVAWDSNNGSSTRLWYEVLNDDLTVRLAPTLLDNSGTINRAPSVTALLNGYFSISYEDNVYSGNGQSDITQQILNANGANFVTLQLETMPGTDSQASTATLSNGMVVTTFTDAFGGTDDDIAAAVYDPTSLAVVVAGQRLPYLATTNSESNSTVIALANNQFAVSDTFVASGSSTSKISTFELVRTINADTGSNVIVGDSGKDVIYALAGNDTVTPGDGADNTVYGDTGYDTVNFSGVLNAYTVTRNGRITTVVRSDGGTDTLDHVEKLHFTNGNLFTPPEVRDLGDDGLSDMLLQNSDGRIAVWQMNGATVTTTTVEATNPGSVWQVKGSGHFDSSDYGDILLQNTSTGAMNIWTMQGATRTATTTLASNAGPTWHAITTGDFNGDGKADILLQNTSGQAAVWLMDSTTITTKSVLTNPGSSWHEIDTGDFNNDGKSDILWQNSANGAIMVWTMNGGAMLAQTAISSSPGTVWQVKSSGDFNGDGNSDILMQNSSTGQIVIWTMNGTTVTSKTALATNPGTSWHVLGSADYNGDGKSDIELQNTNGQIAVWLMNGTTITSRTILPNNPGTAWHVIAGTGA